MRVLFDISVLGFGTVSPKARTGVYQVVCNLARHLARATGIETTFCAPATLLHMLKSRRWAQRELTDLPAVFTPDAAPLPLRLLESLFTALIESAHSRRPHNAASEMIMSLLSAINILGTKSATIAFPDFLLDQKLLAQTDIYHSPFHAFPRHLRESAPDCRLFLTVHDLIPIKFPQYFSGKNTQALTRSLAGLTPEDWILCVSHSTRNDLLEYRKDLDPAQVHVTHLAASSLFYPCSDENQLKKVHRKYHIPPEGEYFLSLGTLEPRKNISAVIRAFFRLLRQEKADNLYLVLAGPAGWNYADLRENMKKFGEFEDRVIVTGFVADEDMAPLYSGALAFVYPSFYEGFGLPPLEAMQCGIPVITSDTSSLPEVVGSAGILVNPSDEESLEKHMFELYTDENLRAEYRQLSQQRAKLFSWENTTKQMIQLYRKSLGG